MAKLFMSLFLFAAISSVYLPITTRANDETENTGNELIKNCNEANYQAQNDLWDYCLGYVSGSFQGVVFGSFTSIGFIKNIHTSQDIDNYYQIIFPMCMPDNVTREQEALVTSKYLKEHPESLNKPSIYLIVKSFLHAWPCPKPAK